MNASPPFDHDNEDLRALREGVRAVVSRFGDDYWLERDEDGIFPREFHRAMAEGGWLGYPYSDRLHTVTHHHEEPVIPRSRVRGAQERIDLFGQVTVPLREEDVREATRELVAEGVEAIGVMFLFSHMNPQHE